MWRGPLEYVTYEFIPSSLAVSRISGSSNLDSFRDGLVSGCTAVALWGAATRTYSIFLAAFLCSCRQAFSPSGKEVAPSSTPRCSSYWKGSLLVVLDYGCRLHPHSSIDTTADSAYITYFEHPLIKEAGFTLKKRWYHAETIIGEDYADDLGLLASTPAQAKYLLHGLGQAARDIGLYLNAY